MAGITDSRQYLATRVMPAIFEALRALDAARPNDPLNFIATELESHSIQGMHNNERLPKAGGNVDMFTYTNGVVRDSLLKAIRSVAAERPRDPLKAIAEELRSLPAWSAANWTSQSKHAGPQRPHAAAAVPLVQVPKSTVSSVETTPRPEVTTSSQHLAAHLERADADSKLRSTSVASSTALRSPTSSSHAGDGPELPVVVDRGRVMPRHSQPPPASPRENSSNSSAVPPTVSSSPARVSLLAGSSRRVPGRPKNSVLLR